MEKNSVDNVSIVFVAFKNFEEKMKDPNFEYIPCTKCIKSFNNEYDFGSLQLAIWELFILFNFILFYFYMVKIKY